ncbi:M4 family metallopeptidase [Sinomonas sp.]|uniref:M4 family metallopeptidase n=1 Tax=Sinomonas sp. TaxID=1914986 RepID=UPI002FE1E644
MMRAPSVPTPPPRQHAIPPYLLERLSQTDADAVPSAVAARAGFGAVAELAERTLRTDERIRRRRTDDGDGSPQSGGAGLRREITDADGEENLPGRLVRKEGQGPVEDPDVNRAYDGLGATYSFLEETFGRSSLDGEGLPLEGTVHYGAGYDNAFWDGTRMVFGDGDGRVFNSFTSSLSIIAHELGHGLLQYTAGLAYEGQSGALNESFADVIGVLVEQHTRGESAEEASWIVGEGIFARGVRGVGVRSLAAPGTAYDDPVLGKDPQPAHMDRYVRTREDNGGVHVNSGIPNRAFYLSAMALGGNAWERAGRIWYETVAGQQLPPEIDFSGFARETVLVAGRLFGRDSAEERAVQEGWETVGVPFWLPAPSS